ncbi:MAG: hypothetical protein LBR64_08925 [Dysgonamonadaceae bacterium]|nr:hypothetical protein [Dysgonamonadaceae bacterium]
MYKWLNIIVFAAFLILGIALALHHEPWADEAQSWLLARDSSLRQLLVERVRYEGSPALWHIIIMPFAKLGFPYRWFNCISVVIASLGPALLIWRSPFPRYVKYLLPWTFFLFYQYGTVARSYCLMFPIIAGLAFIYENRKNRPYLYATLLALLASTNIYGLIISLCLAFLYLIEIIFEYRDKKYILPSALFLLSIMLIALTILLPDDYGYAGGYRLFLDRGIINNCSRIVYILFASASLVDYPKVFTFWNYFEAIPAIVMIVALISISYKNKIFTVIFLPIIALLLFSALKFAAHWHYGIVFLMFIFGFWLTNGRLEKGKMKTALNLCFLPVILIQIFWSVNAFVYDWKQDYCGTKAAAAMLQEIRNEHPEYTFFCTNEWDVSLLPYFEENIFVNFNRGKDFSFYQWSNAVNRENTAADLLRFDPDVVVISTLIQRNADFDEYDRIIGEKYHLIGSFIGSRFWKTAARSRLDADDYLIFKKNCQ